MKNFFLAALVFVFVALHVGAQSKQPEQKKDSLLVTIQMDSTTFKSIIQLINENINGNTLTGKMVLQNILQPMYQNAKFLPALDADKPKQLAPTSKP